jgi:cation diffusion facilitator family transporter
MNRTERERRSARAVDLGLAVNALLAAAKVSVGLLGRSPALVADGINSVGDVVHTAVVRVFMVLARRPADAEHPYGHERMESIAALVTGTFVIATGLAVLLDASHHIWMLGTTPAVGSGAAPMTLWVALGTVVIKGWLTLVTRRVGRQTGNPAVSALAVDHRNDVLSAVGVSISIVLGRAGHGWVDPAAAGLVALLILYTGVEILRESSRDLMGSQPGRQTAQQIAAWLAEVPGVLQVQQVRAHSFGPYLVLNLTIGVDGAISVAEGDRIADAVEAALHERIEFLRAVHVHYHPVGRLPPRTA